MAENSPDVDPTSEDPLAAALRLARNAVQNARLSIVAATDLNERLLGLSLILRDGQKLSRAELDDLIASETARGEQLAALREMFVQLDQCFAAMAPGSGTDV